MEPERDLTTNELVMAQALASYVSGYPDAIPEQEDYELALVLMFIIERHYQ